MIQSQDVKVPIIVYYGSLHSREAAYRGDATLGRLTLGFSDSLVGGATGAGLNDTSCFEPRRYYLKTHTFHGYRFLPADSAGFWVTAQAIWCLVVVKPS
ncbi:hypothetical protein TMatcc_007705 [Talaromyces marneffei ATCC 18224]